MKKDLHRIRPYGDHLNDGRMQFSFTLPIAASPEAREAAKLYVEKLGLTGVQVVWMEAMSEEFAYFVVYGQATATIDVTKIRVPKLEFPILPVSELVTLSRDRIRRKIVVVGGTTGSDAHTVGIDAILSMKGIAGDKGLESYPIFHVVNLRAQVSNERLLERAAEVGADAILVSQVVTQQDQHLGNLRELTRILKHHKTLSSHLIKIVGGPRMDHRTAKSVGFDAGFGPGTKPSEVANYIVHELIGRMQGGSASRAKSDPKKRSFFSWLGSRDDGEN